MLQILIIASGVELPPLAMVDVTMEKSLCNSIDGEMASIARMETKPIVAPCPREEITNAIGVEWGSPVEAGINLWYLNPTSF